METTWRVTKRQHIRYSRSKTLVISRTQPIWAEAPVFTRGTPNESQATLWSLHAFAGRSSAGIVWRRSQCPNAHGHRSRHAHARAGRLELRRLYERDG